MKMTNNRRRQTIPYALAHTTNRSTIDAVTSLRLSYRRKSPIDRDMHTCQPREKVSRDKIVARRVKRDGLRKGGSGGPPPEIFKKPVNFQKTCIANGAI